MFLVSMLFFILFMRNNVVQTLKKTPGVVYSARRTKVFRLFSTSASPTVYTSISFFKFFPIEEKDIDRIVASAKIATAELDIKGTLLVSTEGYNGQFALPSKQIELLSAKLASSDEKLFRDIDINIGKTIEYSSGCGISFPFKKLVIRKKKKVLTDGFNEDGPPLDFSDSAKIGPELSPQEWHSVLSGSGTMEGSLIENNYGEKFQQTAAPILLGKCVLKHNLNFTTTPKINSLLKCQFCGRLQKLVRVGPRQVQGRHPGG
jgi:hypothetical protein